MSASHMSIPALQALKNRRFEDVAYFEPFYLKDFIATKPKKNILGV
jgi:tRNA threonylcarbamoyladenosine biosynthesis protein TsaB